MTTSQKTVLANAAVIVFACSIIVSFLLMVIAITVFGKRLIDLGPVMSVFWALLLAALALGFLARDTSKGKCVVVAGLLLPLAMVALKPIGLGVLPGCQENRATVSSASISLVDSKNARVVQNTVSDGGLLHTVAVAVDKPADQARFKLLMGAGLTGPGGNYDESAAEVIFAFKDGRLSVEPDWKSAGGGERPAFRREGDREITAYYPIGGKNARTWAKYSVSVQ